MFFNCECNLSQIVIPQPHGVGLDSNSHLIKQIQPHMNTEEHMCFNQGHLGAITPTLLLNEVKIQMVEISGWDVG